MLIINGHCSQAHRFNDENLLVRTSSQAYICLVEVKNLVFKQLLLIPISFP
jgi:hypothetical protein